jgi:hypothetical protein
LPLFSTSEHGVNAAFACVLDKTRTPILKALLAMDLEGVQQSCTPASTFRYLGSGGKDDDGEGGDFLPAEIALPEACLFQGNLEAYKALRRTESPNDGQLHHAAFMALPKLVKWLLQFHDPNAKALDVYDQMIPLALACQPRNVPWCKIANQEHGYATRWRKCIELLAPVTDNRWRCKQKTVLHIALESGREVTEVMLNALNPRIDARRNETYLYKDKEGIQYSPDEYVGKLMKGPGTREKTVLLQLLYECDFMQRYYKEIMPGEGDQPAGYCGLPAQYALAWGHTRGGAIRSSDHQKPCGTAATS